MRLIKLKKNSEQYQLSEGERLQEPHWDFLYLGKFKEDRFSVSVSRLQLHQVCRTGKACRAVLTVKHGCPLSHLMRLFYKYKYNTDYIRYKVLYGADREAWVSAFTDVLLNQVLSKELPHNCCKQSYLFQVNFTKEHLAMLSNTVKQVFPKSWVSAFTDIPLLNQSNP